MSLRHAKQPDRPSTTLQPLVATPQPAQLQAPLQPAALVQRAARSPAALTPAEVLQLHRSLGNRAVGQLMRGYLSRQTSKPAASHAGMMVQPKLIVGPEDDPYEREADRVAQHVVQRLDTVAQPPAGQAVQRHEENDQDLLQMQPATIPHHTDESGTATPPDLEAAIQQARGHGQRLPETLRGRMEQAFGADFSGVRLHADAQAEALNRALAAKAFTTGQDVFLRQGASSLTSRSGQEVLAHELSHVVQQGRTAINPDGPLLSHAIAAPGRVQRMIGEGGDGKIVRHKESERKYRARRVEKKKEDDETQYWLEPIGRVETSTMVTATDDRYEIFSEESDWAQGVLPPLPLPPTGTPTTTTTTTTGTSGLTANAGAVISPLRPNLHLPSRREIENELGGPKGQYVESTKYRPVLVALAEYNKFVLDNEISTTGLPKLMKLYAKVEETARNYLKAKEKKRKNHNKIQYMQNMIDVVAVERIQAFTVAEKAEQLYAPGAPRPKWFFGLTMPRLTPPGMIAEMVYGSVIKEKEVKGGEKGGTNEVAKVKVGDETRFWKADKNDVPLAGLLSVYASEKNVEDMSELLPGTRWEGMPAQAIANEYNVPVMAGIIEELPLPEANVTAKNPKTGDAARDKQLMKEERDRKRQEYEKNLEALVKAKGFSEKHDLHLARRDVAMSRLDQLLNVGIIAQAQLALRKIGTGKGATYAMGSLMAGAQGTQAGKIDDWKEVENSGEFQRLLSRLQLLDILAYQVDRNPGNIFVQMDDHGNVIGLTGIDNDMAFGQYATDITRPIQEYPGISALVDEALAERILQLQPQDLADAMRGLLTTEEIDSLIQRLLQLQKHLQQLKNDGKLVPPHKWGKEMVAALLKDKANYYASLSSKLRKGV